MLRSCRPRAPRALLVVLGLFFVMGCGGGGSSLEDTAESAAGLTAVKLTKITLTPASPKPLVGAVTALVATGTYSDTTTKDLTATATWSSANPARATVDNAGNVTALGSGSVVISATVGTIVGKTTVAVQRTLKAITLTPAAPTMVVTTTQTLVATAIYDTNATARLNTGVTWLSSNPGVATVSSTGVVTALASGNTTISATSSTAALAPVTGSTVVTVSNATITSVTVAPATKTLATGATQKFTATGIFSDASKHTLVPPFVSWSSTLPAVATVDATGLATTVHSGTAQIVATYTGNGKTGGAKLTVTGAALVSLAIQGCGDRAMFAGSTSTCRAIGNYNDGTQVDLTQQVTWSSTTPAVGTISNAAGSQGLFTAVAAGNTTVGAIDPISKKATSVVASVSQVLVSSLAFAADNTFGLVGNPASATVRVPDSTTFHVTGFFNNGAPVGADVTEALAWTSSNPAVAIVTQGPTTIQTLAPGTTTLIGTDAASGVSVRATLTVQSAALVSIAITPVSPTIALGSSAALVATGTFGDGTTNAVTSSLTWTSSGAAVTVSNAPGSEGVVTGAEKGSAIVTGTDPTTGIRASVTVNVSGAKLVSIAIKPDAKPIPLGWYRELSVIGTLSNGVTQDVSALVRLEVTGGVGTPSGHYLSAIAQGGGTVTAREWSSGLSASTAFTVGPPALQSVYVDLPFHLSAPGVVRGLPLGRPSAITAYGADTLGASTDISNRVTWSTTSPATVAPGACGRPTLTATALGTLKITATDPVSGLAGTLSDEITVIPALQHPVQISLTAHDSVGTAVDSTTAELYTSINGYTLDTSFYENQSTCQGAPFVVPASDVYLSLGATGRPNALVAPSSFSVEVPTFHAETDRAIDVTLPAMREVRLHVVDPAGQPVVGAQLERFGRSFGALPSPCADGVLCAVDPGVDFYGRGPLSDANGDIFVDTFAGRPFHVGVAPPPGAALLNADADASDDVATVTMPGAALFDFEILGPDGTPLTNQSCVGVTAVDGTVDLGNGFFRARAPLNRNSYFSLGTTSCPGAPNTPDRFGFNGQLQIAGDTTRISVPFAARTVTVTDGTGRPVANASVTIDASGDVDVGPGFQEASAGGHSTRNVAGAPAITDANGQVTLVVVAPRPGRRSHASIEVIPPPGLGLLPSSQSASLNGPIGVTLSGTRSIDIRIVDTAGQPLSAARSATLSLGADDGFSGTSTPDANGRIRTRASAKSLSAQLEIVSTDANANSYFYMSGTIGSTDDVDDEWALSEVVADMLVVDSLGRPVPNAKVYVDASTPGCSGHVLGACGTSGSANATTTATGHTSFRSLVVSSANVYVTTDDPKLLAVSLQLDLRTGHATVTLPPNPCPNGVCPACVAPPAGLISWWRGENDASDQTHARDASGFGNASFTPGTVGQSFLFSNGGYVAAPSAGLPLDASDRTLEAWVRLDAVNPDAESLFAGYGGFGNSEAGFALGATGDQVFFSQWGQAIVGPSLPLATWTHLAVTSTGSVAALYVNGTKVGEQLMPIHTTPGDFVIGAIPNDAFRKLTGAVDEVSIYDRALTASEIGGIYAAGSAGKCR